MGRDRGRKYMPGRGNRKFKGLDEGLNHGGERGMR